MTCGQHALFPHISTNEWTAHRDAPGALFQKSQQGSFPESLFRRAVLLLPGEQGERLPEESSADDPADGPAFDIGWPGGRVKLPGGRPASAVSLLPPEVPPGLEESYASLVKGLLADGGGKKQTIGV